MRERFQPASECSHRIICRISKRCEDAAHLKRYYEKYRGEMTSKPMPEAECNNNDIRRYKFKIATDVRLDNTLPPKSE